jgi:hypothetical protein
MDLAIVSEETGIPVPEEIMAKIKSPTPVTRAHVPDEPEDPPAPPKSWVPITKTAAVRELVSEGFSGSGAEAVSEIKRRHGLTMTADQFSNTKSMIKKGTESSPRARTSMTSSVESLSLQEIIAATQAIRDLVAKSDPATVVRVIEDVDRLVRAYGKDQVVEMVRGMDR